MLIGEPMPVYYLIKLLQEVVLRHFLLVEEVTKDGIERRSFASLLAMLKPP